MSFGEYSELVSPLKNIYEGSAVLPDISTSSKQAA
jgi:hypothetical protein